MTRLASLMVRSASRSSRRRSCIPFRRTVSFSAFEPASAARKSLSADWRNVEFIVIPSLVSRGCRNKSPYLPLFLRAIYCFVSLLRFDFVC